MTAHTAPRFPARAYRENAALHMSSAHQAIDNARQARLHGCHESAVSILNAAQHYRRAYQHRMRQAALVQQADTLRALAASYRQQAADEPGPTSWHSFCLDVAARLDRQAEERHSLAATLPMRLTT